MGAIWNFISGKSTDWDEVERRQAAASSSSSRTRSSGKYYAYCKICGEVNRILAGYDSSPAEATKCLQESSRGCGKGNHVPVVVEGRKP